MVSSGVKFYLQQVVPLGTSQQFVFQFRFLSPGFGLVVSVGLVFFLVPHQVVGE